jgi:membrane associated rhomboid family serine protease
MFPFRDNIPSRTFPSITILLIIANVLAFFLELSVGPKMLDRFFMAFGVVPAFVFSWPGSGEPFSALILPFGLWFVMQFFYGTATLAATTSATAGGTAWWAHVGGFVIGIVLISRLARKPRYASYSRY